MKVLSVRLLSIIWLSSGLLGMVLVFPVGAQEQSQRIPLYTKALASHRPKVYPLGRITGLSEKSDR